MRLPGCSISEDVMCLAILSAFHMQLLPEVRGREWQGIEGKGWGRDCMNKRIVIRDGDEERERAKGRERESVCVCVVEREREC